MICPPHLVRKWAREARETVPNAWVAIVRTTRDLERARSESSLGTQFVVCSREQAKLGYRWKPATISQAVRSNGRLIRGETGAVERLLCCSDCHTPAVDDEGIPLGWIELNTKKRCCANCGSALWQADRTGPRRFPLADYVLRLMKRYLT